MNITDYLAGLISGISVTSFFTGKELYRYYMKDKVQQKQLNRLLKLNHKIQKTQGLKLVKTPKASFEK
jgi:hypothetical protein